MHDLEPTIRSQRVVISRVYPKIDGGRFPVKRIVGDRFAVEAAADWERLVELARTLQVDDPLRRQNGAFGEELGRLMAASPNAEAFNRPKVMCHVAKLGFSQSYAYFAWPNYVKLDPGAIPAHIFRVEQS